MPEQQNKNVTWGDVARKLLGFFAGMQFSLFLLGLILLACVAGSIIPQGSTGDAYLEEYGVTLARIIVTLQLGNVFSCTWFAVLVALLCLNLLLCSILRFPNILHRYKTAYCLEKRLANRDEDFALPLPQGKYPAGFGLEKCQPVQGEDGREYRYTAKNKIGLWGSWVTHLGMLLVIVGFALGRMLAKEYVVYGIPGSTQQVGDTGYALTIDDFSIDLREDYTVEQYTAALTISDGSTSVSGTASVNHPMSAFGLSLYQDSTGWANYVDIYYQGELEDTDLICAGEYTYPSRLPDLVLLFNKFYPDLVQDGNGLSTATPLCNNPHSLYSLYYKNTMMDMNLTEMEAPIEVDDYTFVMRDPVQYTLIVLKSDPTAGLVGVGALVLVLGLLLAFYCRPYQLWTDGETLYARADKAPALLRRQLEAALKKQASDEKGVLK